MLSYDELGNIARLKRLSLINAEKDYLQDLILFSAYSIIGKELVFKGGTCLYKVYKLNRFSEDLDFTLTEKIDLEKFADKIVKDLELLGIKSKVKDIREYRNEIKKLPKGNFSLSKSDSVSWKVLNPDLEINVRLLLNGPLYKGNKETQCFIPLNISTREQVANIEKQTLYTLYKEIPNFELFSMSKEEILAEKIRAIFTRQKPRDIFDLWFLAILNNTAIDINLINKKLSIYNIKFNFEEFSKKIEKMRGLWQIDLKNLIIELPEFDKIKKEILEKFSK